MSLGITDQATLLHARVLEVARRHPARIALVEAGATPGPGGADTCCWTYGELVTAALRIASALPAAPAAGRNPLVAILGSKTRWSIAAILGTLCAGFGYVPIIGLETGTAIDAALDCVQPEAIIATALPDSLMQALTGVNYRPTGVLDLEGDLAAEHFPDTPRLVLGAAVAPHPVEAESFAYVVFTSGSTGNPKGAAVSHRAAAAALDMFQAHIQPGPDDRVAGQVALGFDVSVFDIFVTLGNGGTLILMTLDEDGDDQQVFQRFCADLDHHQVTSLFTVPSLTRAILRTSGCAVLRGLERLLLTGEPLDQPLADRLLSCLPAPAALWNLYGASEFPYVLARRVRRGDALPPGAFNRPGPGVALVLRPLRPDQVHAVSQGSPPDPDAATLTLPATGHAGTRPPMELVVGGPAVFSGYLVSGKLVGAPPPEGLRTADLATRGDEGAIYLLGRADRTVKIAGVRADLDAIEARLEAHPEVVEAAVVPSSDNERLLAFVVGRTPNTGDLAHRLDLHCREAFVSWICPASYQLLDALPRTASGKKDRPALAERPA